MSLRQTPPHQFDDILGIFQLHMAPKINRLKYAAVLWINVVSITRWLIKQRDMYSPFLLITPINVLDIGNIPEQGGKVDWLLPC